MYAHLSNQRHAFKFLIEGIKFRFGRLYETFWFSQSNLKWTMVFIYPGALFYIRWRAEHSFKYNVSIASSDDAEFEELKPTHKEVNIGSKKFREFQNGSGHFYLGGSATVRDLLENMYGAKENVPEGVRVGCHGRMMENDDNVALAVKNFCKRDPSLVLWREVTEVAKKSL